jgi:hypothetical protein
LILPHSTDRGFGVVSPGAPRCRGPSSASPPQPLPHPCLRQRRGAACH